MENSKINFKEMTQQFLNQVEIETTALQPFKFSEPEYRNIKNKYRFMVDKKHKSVKIVDIDDIYGIDELPQEYEDYIDEEDLKSLF